MNFELSRQINTWEKCACDSNLPGIWIIQIRIKRDPPVLNKSELHEPHNSLVLLLLQQFKPLIRIKVGGAPASATIQTTDSWGPLPQLLGTSPFGENCMTLKNFLGSDGPCPHRWITTRKCYDSHSGNEATIISDEDYLPTWKITGANTSITRSHHKGVDSLGANPTNLQDGARNCGILSQNIFVFPEM